MAERPTQEIIDSLYEKHETDLSPVGIQDIRARFRRVMDDWREVTLVRGPKNFGVGYIMIKKEPSAPYFKLVSHGEPMPLFYKRNAVAIEVMPQYRGRGFGHALLSLGVGFVQREIADKGMPTDLGVIAPGIRPNEDFYEQFGFEINHQPNKQFATYAEGYLNASDPILPLKIKPPKRAPRVVK